MSSISKVVIVTPYFVPRGGGLERYAESIASGLAEAEGRAVSVITTGLGVRLKQRQHGGATVYELPVWFKLGNTPLGIGWSRTVRNLLIRLQPDVVNVHLPVPGLGDVAARQARRLHIPVVVTYHAGHLRKGRWGIDAIGWLYEEVVLRGLLERSAGLIATSRFVEREFMQKQKHKTTIINPSYDEAIFKPAARYARDTIIFNAGLGRAEVSKGLKRLLAALAILGRRGLRPQLLIVGDGDERSTYELLATKLGVRDQVQFLGRLEPDAVAKAYRRATVLALPTSNDNFPTVIVEAMACGLPVIATPVGGIPEMVVPGVTGYLVQPRSAAELAERLEQLLTDPRLAHELGRAGLDRVRVTLARSQQLERTERFLAAVGRSSGRPTIAQVAAYYPPHLGGLEKVTAEISERLAAGDYRVEVLTSDRGRGAVSRAEFWPNLRLRRLWSFEFAHTPVVPQLLWRLWRLPKPLVIHLHLAQAGLPEVVWLVSKIRRVPYIVHFHLDVEPSGRLGRLFLVYKRTIQGLVLRDAAKVIVLSPEQARVVREKWLVIRDRVEVIENGVTLPEILPRSFDNSRPLQLLYVGRLTNQKRVDRLLDALSRVSLPLQLTIVGDGEDYGQLIAQARRLGLNNVDFVGRKTGVDLEAYYRVADVFVLPSDREGMPLAVLEAMAYGLPVVGTDVLGIRELVGGVGVLVEPSAPALAHALDRLAGDRSNLPRLSQASRRRAESKSWPPVIESLGQLYAEVSA